ncbi:MAG: ribonuclease [Gammaproteobacteria bacterium]|nr:MAG: ribonuclease [Gammaproteobacteria bacterium]TND04310.1 MAG: ribonuclease [Gammaproteobacteria bacterium]
MRTANSLFRLLRFAITRFTQDRGLRNAASLSYTSLLALVPLMAVIISVLAAFPAFQDLIDTMRDFVFANFVPASGQVVQEYMGQFADKAGKLTAVGTIFLILTSLMLMDTIDGALNDIFRIRAKRGALTRFTVYWAVLSLGPLLIGVSLVLSSYLISLPFIADVEASFGVKRRLLGLLPFLATAGALCLLYMLVPNCKIPGRYAVIGGVAAAVLFEGAKKAFAFYVTSVPTYAVIYGTLATIPMFLVWVYVSWAVVLFGAQITYCLINFRSLSSGDAAVAADLKLVNMFRTVGRLWQAQREGGALSLGQLVQRESGITDGQFTDILTGLEAKQIVHRTDGGDWALSREIGELTMQDLFDVEPMVLPDPKGAWVGVDRWSRALQEVISEVMRQNATILNVSLKSLYDPGGATTRNTTPD